VSGLAGGPTPARGLGDGDGEATGEGDGEATLPGTVGMPVLGELAGDGGTRIDGAEGRVGEAAAGAPPPGATPGA